MFRNNGLALDGGGFQQTSAAQHIAKSYKVIIYISISYLYLVLVAAQFIFVLIYITLLWLDFCVTRIP